MISKYTDLSATYELVEKKKCKGGDKETVFFSLMALRVVPSKNILLILKNKVEKYELFSPDTPRKDARGYDNISILVRSMLIDYIEHTQANPPFDYSKTMLADRFIETLEASLRCFPPIDKVDVSPSGSETVYCFRQIA